MTPDKAASLLALHSGPGFVLPNAWDGGSARLLEQAGFPAIATTSAGIAWSLGIPDGERLDRDTMLEHLGRITRLVEVPVTADLEAGYGATPADVAETVRLALGAGAVGGNIEDAVGGQLLPMEDAVERIAAARAAAPHGAFVLNARTDAFFGAGSDDPFGETTRRAAAFLEAGADCIFVPGVSDAATIGRLAEAIDGPLNIVAGLANAISAPELFALGVRRVSLGGSLARASYSVLERAARELREAGTLEFLDGALSYAEMQGRFA